MSTSCVILRRMIWVFTHRRMALIRTRQVPAFIFLMVAMTSAQGPAAQDRVLRFDGLAIAVAPQSPRFDVGGEFTLETWVYFSDHPKQYDVIMGKVANPRGSDPFVNFVLDTQLDDKIEFIQTTGKPGSFVSIVSPDPIPIRQWVHIAGTLGSGVLRLYINGQLAVTGVSPGPAGGANVPFVLGGGMQGFGGSPCCSIRGGALRQVRLWNRQLTQPEIVAGLSVRMNGSESGLVAQWMLDDAPGQRAVDSGPNHLDLQFGTTAEFDRYDPVTSRAAIVESGPYFAAEPLARSNPSLGGDGRLIDFDQDGDLDFLDFHCDYLFTAGPTYAFRNNGLGIFSDATTGVLGNQEIGTYAPRDFVVADLDRDGRDDILVADHGPDTPPFPGAQSRLLIQGSNAQMVDETGTRLPVKKAFTHSLSSADIDGDGDIDIFVGNLCCPSNPEIYINDGTGHFTADPSRLPPVVASSQRRYTAASFIDLNGDNRAELVLGNFPGDNFPRDTVLVNDGSGRFTEEATGVLPARSGGSDWGIVSMQKGDLDNDGFLDLVLCAVSPSYGQSKLQLLINNRNGTFRDGTTGLDRQPPTSEITSIGGWMPWAFLADLNGDGRKDIVTSSTFRPTIYLNLGAGRFADYSELIPVDTSGGNILPGDIDGDGDQDLVDIHNGGSLNWVLRSLKPLTLPSTGGSIAGTISYYFPPTGQPRPVSGASIVASGSPQRSVVADVNGNYQLTGLSGAQYSVAPSFAGSINGISSQDASRIAQYSAGLVSLTDNQKIAADTTNNGSVTSLDAARLAQYVAGIPNSGITGQWKFTPSVRNYSAPLNDLLGENYEAILVGDVTGNWTPVGTSGPEDPSLKHRAWFSHLQDSLSFSRVFDDPCSPTTSRRPPYGISACLPAPSRTSRDGSLTIPVVVDDLTGRCALSFDFRFQYDPAVVDLVSVTTTGTLAAVFVVESNLNVPGQAAVAGFGSEPLRGAGTLLNLNFHAKGRAVNAPQINWHSFMFNEEPSISVNQ